MSSIASSPALSAFDEIVSKQETDHSREQTRTFADITKTSTMPTKMSNKSANTCQWPAMTPKHSNMTNAWFNKDEEVLSTKIHKSANAWQPVKSSSDIPGTSFNEDEKKQYVSEGKLHCSDRILKLNKLSCIARLHTGFFIAYLHRCFQKQKMKVIHLAKRKRKKREKELCCLQLV